MKFSTLHKQRKYLLISASAGLFSLLLPWISFYTELISETTNGFHSYGIIVFLAFLGSILLILKGDGTQPLDKVKWMTILLSGVVALLFTLIYMESSSEPSIFDTGYGIGIKISLLASTCMIIFSWLLKNKEDDLQNSFISLSFRQGQKLFHLKPVF